MKKISLDTWIQLIGMTSIVASLLFVGLEMRQSQMIAQAGQQQERTAYFFNLLGSVSESGVDWQSVVMETNSDYGEKFKKAEILRRNIFHAHIFTYENDYFQYSQGLMPQEVWNAKLKALTFFYNQCDMRSLWISRQQFFPDGYVSIIESIPDQCTEQR